MDKPLRRHKPHLGRDLVLVDVYEDDACTHESCVMFLYQLIEEREPNVNISHREMPSWEAHCDFVAGRPYPGWFVLCYQESAAGSIYITRKGELGVFIKREYQGLGIAKSAIRRMMQKFPRHRYLANINPNNTRSIQMFENLGFTHLQNTYELRKD